MTPLSHDWILKLQQAAIEAGLSRTNLLVGIERRLIEGLQQASTPAAQHLQDLVALNELELQGDNPAPLMTWLKNAAALSLNPKTGAAFQEALEALGGSAPEPAASAPREREARALLRRFEGPDGRRRLEEALMRQSIVEHKPEVARALAERATLCDYEPDGVLMEQDGSDSDLFLLLVGRVRVEIHGTQVASREAGQHVGEMAMIDPTVKRSATVRATESTVAAILAERDFAPIADRHPTVWRTLAVDLGRRLRERGGLIEPASKRRS